MKKYLLLMLGIVLFSSLNFYNFSLAQQEPLQEDKPLVEKGIEVLKRNVKEVLEIWKGVHQKIFEWWREDILPKIQAKIQGWFEKKKPEIREEFEKKKKEMKEEIRKNFSKLWEWLKDLIK